MNSTRALAYCRILAGISAAIVLAWIALSRGGLDLTGKPLGTDFLSFWAASTLALSGQAASVYDVAAHYAAQRAVFPGTDPGYAAFFYPPVYLLFCLPLALFPYLVSLGVWLGATGYAYWIVVQRFLRVEGSQMLLPMLAFPAVLINAGHGQNAFLATALFGGALLLQARPVFAGICFGALIFKPHLGLLIPFVLAAGGYWKSFAAASATVAALLLLSVAVFGLDIWRAYFDILPLAREALEQDLVGPAKMPSLFAAIRLWHGSLTLAYAAHAALAVVACAILIHFFRTRLHGDAEGPALVTASMFASPFLLDYDLTLLAIPLAWVYAEAQRTGFLPWEKVTLMAGFMLPLLARVLATQFLLPAGPLVIACLLLIVLRRGFARAAI